MTGEPFHYRAMDDGGYTLYSVAWNLTDDGGKSDPKLNNKQQPDWVWTMPGNSPERTRRFLDSRAGRRGRCAPQHSRP